MNKDELKRELEQRRQDQHLVTKRKMQDNQVVHFRVGDLVMLKAPSRLDQPRDLFIVAEDLTNGFLKIRKSEKQWHHKTYRVRPSQLLKVFDSLNTDSPPVPKDSTLAGNHLPVSDVTPQKATRQSKLKARLTMQQQSRSRLVNIKEHLRRMNIERKFVDLVFHFPTQAPTFTDAPNVNEDSDNYLSLTEEVSDESILGQEQSTAISVTTMGDTYREILQSQSKDSAASEQHQ